MNPRVVHVLSGRHGTVAAITDAPFPEDVHAWIEFDDAPGTAESHRAMHLWPENPAD